MESMDYSYNAFTAAQPYQFWGNGDNMLGQSTNNDAAGPVESMENALDPTFLASTFEYPFDTSLGPSTGLTPFPPATSASPPAQQLSSFSNESRDSGILLDMDSEPPGRRSSSEEKQDMTPSQQRRKAQNRAAQRAFRERKERHVRDLEAKLNLLTTTTSSLQSDNERLKLMLQRMQTENEILRAKAPSTNHPPGFVDDPSLLPSAQATRTSSMDSTRRASGMRSRAASPRSRFGSSPRSESQLLSASATWDLLQSHPLYMSGVVDIGEVCERLKKMARCDGMGPMFEEDQVRKVIEEVGRSGGDELI